LKERVKTDFFYSVRKFFEVPDGTYLNMSGFNINIKIKSNPNLKFNHLHSEYQNEKNRYKNLY
jgi:hypothetical protein